MKALVLYVDILFLINFSMDFLSLFLCSMILHKRKNKLRFFLASLVGAIYGVTQVLCSIDGIINLLLCILIGVAMCLIAYKDKGIGRTLISVALYTFISATLGGIMSLVYSFFNRILADIINQYTYEGAYNGARTFIIIGITAIFAMVISRILTKKKDVKTVELKVTFCENEYKLQGLCDSGNLLTEPFSGKCVILVSENSKLGIEIKNTSDIRKRYIPYRDVNGEGVIMGICPSKIDINGRLVDAVVASSKNKDFGGYDALVPNAIL